MIYVYLAKPRDVIRCTTSTTGNTIGQKYCNKSSTKLNQGNPVEIASAVPDISRNKQKDRQKNDFLKYRIYIWGKTCKYKQTHFFYFHFFFAT